MGRSLQFGCAPLAPGLLPGLVRLRYLIPGRLPKSRSGISGRLCGTRIQEENPGGTSFVIARKTPISKGSMTRRSLLSATGAIAVIDVEPKPRDRFARANENVRELMLLLDTDNHGRISSRNGGTSWKRSSTSWIKTGTENSTGNSCSERSSQEGSAVLQASLSNYFHRTDATSGSALRDSSISDSVRHGGSPSTRPFFRRNHL